MVIIKTGNNYNISFQFKNASNSIAKNVVAQVGVDPNLTLNSIISTVGLIGPGLSEYTLGDILPLSTYEIIVNVTVDVEDASLPVTMTITTDNPDSDTDNNSITKNIVESLDGILCTAIGVCIPQGPQGIQGDTGADGDLLDKRIVVTQASDFGVIDSTKEYFLDGIIDMGSTSIEVPSGGIYITGYNFDISGLTSTENGFTLFTSPVEGSGNILFADFHIDISGTSSQVYDVEGGTGFEAVEVTRVNWNNCASLGEITNYRQGLETGTGRFGGTPNLILSGTWLGGYFIETSIVRGLVDGPYALFEEGTSFVMNSRFRTNMNVDLNSAVALLDFNSTNFVNPNTLQLTECIVTRNGVTNPADATLIPNISHADVESKWKNNIGLPNTFAGGEARITTEISTTIPVAGTFVDLAGTYTTSNLSHFDSPANGQLRHLGDSSKEYKVLINSILDSSPWNELDMKIVVWDDSASGFVDYKVLRRVVNSLQGGRDVAFFTFVSNVVLDKNDYVKIQVANVNDTSNITGELDTEISVEER